MKYIVKQDEAGLTLKLVLKERIGISSRLYTRLKRHRRVMVDGQERKFHDPVHAGEMIEIGFDYEANTYDPEPYDLEVLFEDDVLLIVNKDPFCVVHPTQGHPTGTLMNYAAHYLEGQGDTSKIRFVNRLDRDTSGIVIMAKNQFIHHQMSEAMKRDTVEKRYLALVEGDLDGEGLIDAPIMREEDFSMIRVVRPDGKPSRTRYRTVRRFGDCTLLELELLTGRTHQIRVHLKHIGHPIIGDALYHEASDHIDRQCLHCRMMAFDHPLTKERLVIEAPLKADMAGLIETLGGMG